MKQAGPPSPPREPAGCGLVLMRHGESEWNAKNLFTGWANPPLTAAGERDAIRAGHLLAARGLLPAAVHTSLQRRAIRTAELALAACDCDWIGVYRSWRLNGRHYGALQGRDKSQVRAEYGDAQLMRWRRSFDVPPPPLAPGARHSQFGDPRYASLPPEARPSGESLRDVTGRLLPYWYDVLVPQLRTGTNVLVVSHGNTLRALVKHLDSITDEDIMAVDVPNAVPLLYQFDDRMRPLTPGARYLSGMGTSPGSP